MAYEASGFPSEVIEKALAHEEKNKVKGAYNRAEYLGQRHQLMQWWGDKLQVLEHGAEIIPLDKPQCEISGSILPYGDDLLAVMWEMISLETSFLSATCLQFKKITGEVTRKAVSRRL